MANRQPRRFFLERYEDPTGVSGTGTVAEGIEFTDGWCVIHWRTRWTSVTTYPNIEHIKHIHCHDGKTEIVWIDRD